MNPKPRKTERRAPRSWMITALLASLAVAYVAFVFVPAQAEISVLRSRLNERRQHILQASGLVLPVEHATQQLVKTRLISTSWREAAPNPAELSGCFASLTTQAKAAGIAIERFDPQNSTDMQVVSLHGVTVHFHGSFEQAFDFLRRIEELPATVWLPHLKISQEQSGPKLRGELNLTIFVDRTDSAD
jgi:Tfp pilus assembly protein PilO